MLNSFVTFFNNISLDEEVLEHKKYSDAKGIIYRDELSYKKKTSCIEQARRKQKKYCNSLEYSEPLIKKEPEAKMADGEEIKGVIRVKVKMTKQEANRLLSRCKDGGVLEFKDVARELVQIPVDRVAVFHPPSTTTCRGTSTVLKTIPEDL